MSKLNPQFVAQVQRIMEVLDTLDYFQLLRVGYEATPQEIRSGYHRQARTFHPDRYQYLDEPELVSDLTTISKRITEAYVTLRDSQRRDRYRNNIQGENRASNLRYDENDEVEQRAQEGARSGSTAQGRKLFGEASDAYCRGDLGSAIKNLKMALVYEQNNASFKETLAQWQRELDGSK